MGDGPAAGTSAPRSVGVVHEPTDIRERRRRDRRGSIGPVREDPAKVGLIFHQFSPLRPQGSQTLVDRFGHQPLEAGRAGIADLLSQILRIDFQTETGE